MGLLQHAIQNNMETTVQILGVGVTLGLCFIGIANLTWVKIISLYTAVLTLTQNILLQQHAVTAMYTINIAYYLIVLFEDKYPTLKTPALKYGAPTLAIATAATTNLHPTPTTHRITCDTCDIWGNHRTPHGQSPQIPHTQSSHCN